MPKPMKMLIEVEEIAYGRVFRTLDGMDGVVSITPIGEGPKSQQPSRVLGKRGGAQSSECAVLGALIGSDKGKGSHPRTELAEALVAAGRKPGGVAGVMTALVQKKHARVVSGKGTKGVLYAITPAGIKRYETACSIKE